MLQHETVAHILDLPDDLLAVIQHRLASGRTLVGNGGTMAIERRLPHENVGRLGSVERWVDLEPFSDDFGTGRHVK